jgi:DNA replication and repair protein RecF
LIVTQLEFDGFRNLETGFIRPDPDINIFYGDNAQGKTNLLESLWLFTGGRSFRGSKDSETVCFGKERAKLGLEFFSQDRSQRAEIEIQKRRKAMLGGVPLSSPAKLAGHFCAVVFSPAHLSLIKDGPDGRRRFIDAAYCQIRPSYIKILSDFQRTLAQRNALLKKIKTSGRFSSADINALEIWNERFAQAGANVFAARTAYIRRLIPAAQSIYNGISRGGESFSISYLSNAGDEKTTPDNAYKTLISLLTQNKEADIAAGFSTEGPHRDDLEILIGGKSARLFGSQGQQRSAVLALKLAEASLLKDVTGEQPVALLDDVMSELDTSRQDYILNHISGWQVFITCCDPNPVIRMTGGKAFRVDKGRITEQTLKSN